MLWSNFKKYSLVNFFWCSSMLLLAILCPVQSDAQSCECTNCPAVIPASNTVNFEFDASGAVNNDLSSAGQGVCGVYIEFIPQHIWSIEMTLTSPGGQQVTLVGPQLSQAGSTGFFPWEITFLPCGDPVVPDPGFNPTWDNNQTWVLFGIYTGSYYPQNGCLEDFNTGSVDGIWTLSVDNANLVNIAQVLEFSVIFCDDDGLDCFECEAEAGGLSDTTAVTACMGDTSSLIIDLDPTFSGTPIDPSIYGYTYLISQSDTILAYDTLPDLSNLRGGVYKINGMAYRWNDTLDIPSPNNALTVTELNTNLISNAPDFCGAITDTCLTVTIIEIDTTFLFETICAADTFHLDTFQFFNTGVYPVNLLSSMNCDSTVVLELNVRAAIDTSLFVSICQEDTYSFNGLNLDSTGVYYDTLTSVISGCDSLIILNLEKRDSILTNLSAVICNGDSYSVGSMNYSTTGTHTTILDAANSCDSIVVLDLIVLDPIVMVATPDAIDCDNSSIILDASASSGEAIIFEWIHLDNGGDGVVNGAQSAMPEVNKSGIYLLVVTDTLGGNLCTDFTNILVTLDTLPPNVSATGGTITCSDPQITLQGNTTTSGATTMWSGPDIVNPSLQNPTIGIAGAYTFVVTGQNGCIDSVEVMVVGDTIAPQISASVNDTLDCSTNLVQLQANSLTAIDFLWTGPSSFSSGLQNPTTSIPGLYTVRATAANGCMDSTQVEVIEDIIIPDVQAFGDTLDCTNAIAQLQGSSSTADVSYAWTGPNSFSSGLQNPQVTDIGIYTLVVTAPNGCTTTAQAEVLQDDDVPDVQALGDTLDCNNAIAQLLGNSTIVGVSYEWSGPNSFSSGLQNPQATDIGTYTLVVTAPNACTAIATTEVIQDASLPDILAIGDTIDCLNSLAQLQGNSTTLGVSYEWSGPNSFSSGLQNPQVTDIGIYTLVITAPNSCTVTAQVEVIEDIAVPDIMAIGDTIDCSTVIAQLQGNSSTLGVTYQWTGPNSFVSGLQNPQVTTLGFYTLIVTAPNGCSATAQVEVIEDNAIPNITALGDTLDCNNAMAQLQGNSTTVGVSYSWSGPNSFNSDLPNPQTSTLGIYTLIITAPNSCTATTQVEVLQDNDVPDVVAMGDTLDCNNAIAQLLGNSTTLSVIYQWSGPNSFSSGLQNPQVAILGTYNLVVTASNGCTATTTAEVREDFALPDISVITDTIDCNNNIAQLQGNSTTLGVSYEWSGPASFSSNLQNPTVTNMGNYTLVVTAANGCTAMETVMVLDDLAPPNISAIGDTIDCNNNITQLQGNSNTPDVTYQWSGPSSFSSGLQNPPVTDIGTYTLTVTGVNGCTAVEMVELIEDIALPDIAAMGDTLDCSNAIAQLQGNSTTLGVTYFWSGPNSFSSNLQNPQVTLLGTYTLVVTVPNNCTASIQVDILEDEDVPDVSAVGDTLDCNTTMAQLQGNSSIIGATYQWSGPSGFSSGLQNPQTADIGLYTLVVTAPNGCTAVETTEVINDFLPPNISIINDTLDCNNTTIQLQGNSTNVGATYQWSGPNSFDSNLQNPEVTETGIYTLVVTGLNACTSMETVEVIQDFATPNIFAQGDTLDCNNAIAQLQGNSSSLGVTYQWSGPGSFSSGLQNPIVSDIGNYTLIITAPNGCTATETVEVIQDAFLPDILAIGDTLDCNNAMAQLQGSSMTADVTYQWSGPGAFFSGLQNPQATIIGTYTLVVTAPNGCTSTAQAMVLQDEAVPDIAILTDTLDCNNAMVQLQAISTITDLNYQWTGPNSFNSMLDNPQVTDIGVYNLVVTASNGCTTTIQTTVTEDFSLPDVAALGDTLDCSSALAQLTGNSTIVGVSYQWTGPSSFSSGLQNPQVTAGGIYTLVVTAPNGCTAMADAEIIQDASVPDAFALGDTLDCANAIAQLQGSSTTLGVTYQWSGPNSFSANLPNPTTTTLGNYTLIVTASNGCTAIAQTSVIQDMMAPDIFVIGDTLDCNTTIAQLAANSTTTGVTYLWSGPSSFSSNLPNPTTTIIGTYTLIVTAPNACTATAQTEVIQDLIAPDALALGDTLNCTNVLAQLQGSSTTLDVSYQWTGPNSFASDLQNPEVAEIGLYVLTVTAPNGCTGTAQAEVLQDVALPDASALGDTLDCNATVVTLQGNSTTLDVTYQWSGPNSFTSNLQNPQVNTPGVYVLTVTAPNTCTATAQVEVLQDEAVPDIQALGNTLDCTVTSVQIQGSSTTTGVTYFWTGPNSFTSNMANPSVSEPGMYQLLVTAPNGCQAMASAEVIQESTSLVAQANVTDTLTCEVTSIVLDGNGSSVGTGVIYKWRNVLGDSIGNGIEQIVTEPGIYTLEVSLENTTCMVMTQVTVIGNTDPPNAVIIALGNQEISCMSTSITLNGSDSTPSGSLTYLWLSNNDTLATGLELEVSAAATYHLLVVNEENGCIAIDSIAITGSTELPEVNINDPALLDCAQTQIELDASNSSVGTNYTYQWTGAGLVSGVNTLTPLINQPGEYQLYITNTDNLCADSASVFVDIDTISPIVLTTVFGELDCFNPQVTVSGVGSSTGASFTYVWSGGGILFGDTTLQVQVNQTGLYTLVVTNETNSCQATSTVAVMGEDDFIENALVELKPPTCFGDRNGRIHIDSIIGGTPPYLIALDGGTPQGNPSFNNLYAGSYQLQVFDAMGCEWETTIVLDQVAAIQLDLGPDTMLVLGDSFNLDPQINLSLASLDTFIWTQINTPVCDTCFEQWVHPKDNSLFTLEVIDTNGCKARDEVKVLLDKQRLLYIPNTFSPNNDGLNDFFIIQAGKDVVQIKTFRIFNRWGGLVFEKNNFLPNNPTAGWDGTLKGQKLNPAVFVYYVEVQFLDGLIERYQGDITLHR